MRSGDRAFWPRVNCWVLCALCVIGPARAQEPMTPVATDTPTKPEATTPAGGIGPLSPDVRMDSLLNPPSQPIWARFMLHNLSAESVDLGALPLNHGVSLPRELIVGTAEQPALFVAYEQEAPVPIKPPPPAEGAAEQERRPLKIGGYGSLGARVDLREIHKLLRYPGAYRLEWKPLGGAVGTASVSFRVEPRQLALLVTDYGKITFHLNYDEAPLNVSNFLELARQNFYADKTFHRIIPGFVIQGGCPLGTGAGVRPDGKLIQAEFRDAPFGVGTLAMAHKPDEPNSASCQFFVTLTRVPELDGQYTIIGHADDPESLRTLEQIASVSTDAKDRPKRPVVIRSVSLIDEREALAPGG